MSEPKVCEYLRIFGMDSLRTDFGVTAKRHGEFPNLVMFKYSQSDSPMSYPMVQECRGLILDEARDWAVVSWPFNKFFNHGEGNAAPIDWATAEVQEKLDGSLMTLYWYADAWRVASSGVPDASGSVGDSGMTMAQLFWQTWGELGYALPNDCDTGFCYMFELMTPDNRVVVPHKEPRLALIGCRFCADGSEHKPHVARHGHNWKWVQSHRLFTLEEILAAAAKIDPMESEGYVVCDADFNRIKVKSPAYVALHHLAGGMSARRMLEVVRTNESAEFLAYFPALADEYKDISGRYASLIDDTLAAYQRHKDLESQKDFAMAVKDMPVSGALFALRSGRALNCESYYANVSIDGVMKLLDMKDEALIPVTG